MDSNKILGIEIENNSKRLILEKIIKYRENVSGFLHIVSLNPENIVIAQKDNGFKNILNCAQIKIIDGVGIILAAHLLQIEIGERIPGVDLMESILESHQKEPLRVLFIGGKQNLAHQLAECYAKKRAEFQFKGIMGYININNPTKAEENTVISIITDYKPQLIFASFGSPNQEKWFWTHRELLSGVIGMGVGGGFDFLAGQVSRAPRLIRNMGLEWLFRLTIQPWRIKRQLRIATFLYLVLKQRLLGRNNL